MRVVVFAYHEIGYACLETLINNNEEILAVVTHCDDPNENIWFRSVKGLALKNGLKVYEPDDVNNNNFISIIEKFSPDIIFSFHFRQLFSKMLIDTARLGCINMHTSLLPKYRGRAPINWAIINGEEKTGLTLHYITEKPDYGDIISQSEVAIDIDDTAYTLYIKMAKESGKLLAETLPLLKKGKVHATPQDHSKATYFGRRTPEDGLIDWNKSAKEIHNLVRAVTHPYPGAFTFYNGKKIYVWRTALTEADKRRNGLSRGQIIRPVEGEGIMVCVEDMPILFKEIQVEGFKEMRADILIKTANIPIGAVLGN